jgi:predicted RNA-binding protein Jag
LFLLSLIVACALVPASANAASPSKSRTLSVKVDISSFHAKRARTTASGTATALLTDNKGHVTKLKQTVTLSVKSGGSCRILSLVLDELKLNLLGLNVKLDKVNLQVTGNKRGGVLGSLFCKLARAQVKVKRASAAHALNKRLRHAPLRPIAFRVPVKPVTAAQNAPTTCQVLNLVLGPLHLDLLGLVVDLNKVNLNITATRGQGQLGDTFCQLADDNTSGAPQ